MCSGKLDVGRVSLIRAARAYLFLSFFQRNSFFLNSTWLLHCAGPAATPRARSNMLSMLSSQGASGLIELPLGNYASGSCAPASCNSINEHSSMRSASSIGAPHRSQSLLNTASGTACVLPVIAYLQIDNTPVVPERYRLPCSRAYT